MGCDGRQRGESCEHPGGPGNSPRPSGACGVEALRDANRSSFMRFLLHWIALERDGKDKSGQVRHQPDGAEQKPECQEVVQVLLSAFRE